LYITTDDYNNSYAKEVLKTKAILLRNTEQLGYFLGGQGTKHWHFDLSVP